MERNSKIVIHIQNHKVGVRTYTPVVLNNQETFSPFFERTIIIRFLGKVLPS